MEKWGLLEGVRVGIAVLGVYGIPGVPFATEGKTLPSQLLALKLCRTATVTLKKVTL